MRNVILIIIIICCADIASAQRYITREDAVTAATNKVNQLFPHTNRLAIQVDTLKSESGEVIGCESLHTHSSSVQETYRYLYPAWW